MSLQSSLVRPLPAPVSAGPKPLSIGLIIIVLGVLAAWFLRSAPPTQAPLVAPATPHYLRPAAAPEPQLQTFKPLTPDQALAANAALPVSDAPVEAAPSFHAPTSGLTATVANSELDCLASAIYYEAGSESEQGQRAVAQVVLNRVRHPSFPKSICGVVYQGSERATGCQFTFTCDGSLARKPSAAGWARAQRIARAAMAGAIEPSVGMATHYHTVWVVPYWAPSLSKITTVGAHIFYRWKGYWGRRSAFTGGYAADSLAPQLADPGATLIGQSLEAVSPAAAAAALNRTHLLADEGSVMLGETQAAGVARALKAPLAADQRSGKLVVDEDSGKDAADTAGALADAPTAIKIAIP